MKKQFILLLTLFAYNLQSQITDLRCDLLLQTDKVYKNGIPVTIPLAEAVQQKDVYQFAHIFNKKPRFTWSTDTTIKGITAYHILVATTPQYLAENKADRWNFRKQELGQSSKFLKSASVIYNGKPLEIGKIYYWTVKIWDENNNETPFSDIASFYLNAPDSAEVFAHHPLSAEIQKPIDVVKKNDGSYFLDFGKDALGQLSLHLTSEQADSIWIEVGEALADKNTIHKEAGRNIRYLRYPLSIKAGTHDYTLKWETNEKRNSRNPVMMPDYIGEVYPFRYVSIENKKGIIKDVSVQRKIVFYPFNDKAASFTSSDTVLNQVWDLCKYSIKATSFTGYYIDGDRERIPYEADAVINQLSHYAVDAEYSMARRSLNYLIYHPTWPTEWSLQNVLLAWNDYMYTGDDLFLKNFYSELKLKTLMPLASENGLISTRTNKQTDEFLKTIHITKTFDGRRGLHDIVDWPQKSGFIGTEKEYDGETDGFIFNTYNAVVNAYYYQNLVLMQKIAMALYQTEEAELYKTKAQQVYNSFQTVFRDAQTGLIKDGDSTNHTSLHSNMFALAFGLIPDKDIQKVSAFIKSRRMACSVYGSQFLLDALYDGGQGDYGLELMTATTQRSWYNMIKTGSTISLEAWDKVYKPNLDWNHAWGAAPANIIVRKLMGIEPLSPAFETFQIKPQFGHLTHANVTTPTIKGPISVNFNKNTVQRTPLREGIRLEIIVPSCTTATVYVPQNNNQVDLYINGKKSSILPTNGYYIVENVKAGRHVFDVK
ncbi:MAG: family 78 glycoside hydrolase catalytic domain [Saprospiraceae bacterium]|nr:family 78 glycoside hydrolase catalytic domain [Saprospiraceae bacterium]